MRVLVVNAGSTSLKRHLVEGDKAGAVDGYTGCDAVGHRVVHGGARFVEPVVIDDEVKTAIRELTPLAPLHNAPALAAIERAQRALPGVPHVAVFDTAFHATMPEEAKRYAVPEQWHRWGVLRYGFHGLSVQWAASQVRVPRLVVCHLGGGSSVTAVLDGRSVETTMGFSPLEGVPMTTRSGSLDPGALLYLIREHGLTADEIDHVLEHESGLAALSGTSGDVRELADDSLALAVYVHRVAAAVAASAAALGGLDAVAFTGGIGEHSAVVRDRVCERVRFLGDFEARVVEAREELVIARAVRDVLQGQTPGGLSRERYVKTISPPPESS
jgi:acetate kinase